MLKRSPWPVIMQIVPELAAGGAERTAIEVAEAVTLGGGRAIVLSAGGRLEDELREAGGELIRFPAATKNPAALLMNAMRIASLATRHGVSLVHARSRAPAWSAYGAARWRKLAFVTTYHGIYNQRGPLKAFYNGVMGRGDAVICNSHYTASIVKIRQPYAASRTFVIHRGVDLARFDPDTVSEARIRNVRAAWGVTPSARVILVPARLTRWKGHALVIEAASKLESIADGQNLVFVFVGDAQGRASYEEELQRRIAGSGLQKRVLLAGHCHDMPAAFAASLLTVVPSLEAEAFGRVSIEAQAMGCPVIAADIGGLPETLAPLNAFDTAESGLPPCATGLWLFEPGDATALTEAIASAVTLGDPLMQQVRDRVTAHARARFSKHQLQAGTLAVYDRLLGTQLAGTFARRLMPR